MIEWLLIGTAWIWGIKAIFTYPFIFWKQGEWLEGILKKWICKPLFRCPVCMASFHGTFIFLFSNVSIFLYPVFIIALAGISYLIVEILYPEHEVEFLEEEQKKS